MTPKALYWIALGVFALALNSEYRNGGLPLAHRVAGRAEAVLCQAATRVEQTLAMAGVLKGRPDQEWSADAYLAQQQAQVERVMALHQAELERAMALRQADLERVQQRVNQMQVVMDRVQVEKLRKLDRMQFKISDATSRRVFLVCPKAGKQIAIEADSDVPDVSDVSDDSD